MSDAVPPPGSVIGGKYRIGRLLGQGGMGAVFEAHHTVTGRRVALKLMRPELAAIPEASERFLREARICGSVEHPNVVKIHDVIGDGNSLCLVMEFLEGEPLRALLQRRAAGGAAPALRGGVASEPLPYVLSLVIDAMRGVAAIHRAGVLHRDLKPDNILLAREPDRERPVPTVLDFGIAKTLGGPTALTHTGALVGTPHYMAREQLGAAKDIDVRADVYAFGVIVYEAATGRLPFEADDLVSLVAKMSNEEPQDPRVHRPDLPDGLARVILGAIARDRAGRPADMAAFIRELEPFAAEAGGAKPIDVEARTELAAEVTPAHVPTAVPADQRPVAQPGVRTVAAPGARSRAPLLAAASVVGAGLLFMAWRSQTPARSESEVSSAAVLPAGDGVPEAKTSSESAVRMLLDAWLAAQNDGDFAAYERLYAPDFVGVKRVGANKREEFDRAGWLADRNKMFRKQMTVTARQLTIEPLGDGVRLRFEQTWSSTHYSDRGPKELILVNRDGSWLIQREELLDSTVLRGE